MILSKRASMTKKASINLLAVWMQCKVLNLYLDKFLWRFSGRSRPAGKAVGRLGSILSPLSYNKKGEQDALLG
jgi:hypothetical protein